MSSLLIVHPDGEQFEVPLANSNICKIHQSNVAEYEILDPFEKIQLLKVPIASVEFAKDLCRLLTAGGHLEIHQTTHDADIKLKLLMAGFGRIKISEENLVMAEKLASTTAQAVSVNRQEDDLIADDDLLEPSDYLKPTPTFDCGPGNSSAPKKACKNCSCGLASVQQEEQKATIDPIAKASSCGSCYLGDAFRCGGCPYRGLPAFEAGQQVQIPTSLMQDDL